MPRAVWATIRRGRAASSLGADDGPQRSPRVKCPWCREELPALRKAPACPHCGRAVETDAGERLRPLDLDYDAILRDADDRSMRWTRRGAVVAFGLAVFSLVPVLGAAISFVLLVIAQFVWVAFFVSRPYHRHFGALRRFVTRWVRRLAMVLVVVPLHASVFVPFVGLVATPAVFFGACWAVRAYGRFHLVRERERKPITVAEKLLLVLLTLVVLGGLCLAGLLVYLGVVTLDALSK
jgi:hypothetical protein